MCMQVFKHWLGVKRKQDLFIHLADTFMQSDLQYRCTMFCLLHGNKTTRDLLIKIEFCLLMLRGIIVDQISSIDILRYLAIAF